MAKKEKVDKVGIGRYLRHQEKERAARVLKRGLEPALSLAYSFGRRGEIQNLRILQAAARRLPWEQLEEMVDKSITEGMLSMPDDGSDDA